MTEPLRVLLPMLTLVPDEMGGSERAARALVDGLVDRGLEVTVVLNRGARGWTQGAAPEVVLERWSGSGSTASRMDAALMSRVTGRRALTHASEFDLIHYPLTVTAPPAPRGVPVVQTFLDTQHLDLPHLFSGAERLYRRLAYDAPARKVDAIVTISDFSRERIVEHLGVPAERVHVAPLGVTHPDGSVLAVERQQFVLYPARVWPHKNHSRLVDAMDRVRREHPGMRLVLTGGALDSLGELPPWVERRGHVSDAELWDLYRQAACVAFPSLYEGFGMPPLEAMAQGCPVAASAIPTISEVCGSSAVLFDPTDVTSIATGIVRAIDDHERLGPAGRERAAMFTWDRFVDAHLIAYSAAVEAHTSA